jgi:excisionase family DNA binding protein
MGLQSIKETALQVGVSTDTIRRLIADKAIPAVRIRRRLMISRTVAEQLCTRGTPYRPVARASR